jgi:hypothetical protein
MASANGFLSIMCDRAMKKAMKKALRELSSLETLSCILRVFGARLLLYERTILACGGSCVRRRHCKMVRKCCQVEEIRQYLFKKDFG